MFRNRCTPGYGYFLGKSSSVGFRTPSSGPRMPQFAIGKEISVIALIDSPKHPFFVRFATSTKIVDNWFYGRVPYDWHWSISPGYSRAMSGH
jgi:hypothetical protein